MLCLQEHSAVPNILHRAEAKINSISAFWTHPAPRDATIPTEAFANTQHAPAPSSPLDPASLAPIARAGANHKLPTPRAVPTVQILHNALNGIVNEDPILPIQPIVLKGKFHPVQH